MGVINLDRMKRAKGNGIRECKTCGNPVRDGTVVEIGGDTLYFCCFKCEKFYFENEGRFYFEKERV